MRQFVIGFDIPGSPPVECVDVECGENDVLGVIGEVLSRISQLDDGETVTITCLEE